MSRKTPFLSFFLTLTHLPSQLGIVPSLKDMLCLSGNYRCNSVNKRNIVLQYTKCVRSLVEKTTETGAPTNIAVFAVNFYKMQLSKS